MQIGCLRGCFSWSALWPFENDGSFMTDFLVKTSKTPPSICYIFKGVEEFKTERTPPDQRQGKQTCVVPTLLEFTAKITVYEVKDVCNGIILLLLVLDVQHVVISFYPPHANSILEGMLVVEHFVGIWLVYGESGLGGCTPSYILHTRAFGTCLWGGCLPCRKYSKVMIFYM